MNESPDTLNGEAGRLLGAAPLLALASKWESEASESAERFNELTYGSASVGAMNCKILTLRNHAKALRAAIEAARANSKLTDGGTKTL